MSSQLKQVMDSDVQPAKKGRGKHYLSDNSSATAIKRRLQREFAQLNKQKTLFGDFAGGYGPHGGKAGTTSTVKPPNGGTQGTYVFFKSLFPGMRLATVGRK